ncbi:hypothetical protein [Mesorhizobium sp.]|uniref:hypothetical protein n=1 Tax=Mesorhizobium sp. TaxID=1871066 RepID=UPI003BABAE89
MLQEDVSVIFGLIHNRRAMNLSRKRRDENVSKYRIIIAMLEAKIEEIRRSTGEQSLYESELEFISRFNSVIDDSIEIAGSLPIIEDEIDGLRPKIIPDMEDGEDFGMLRAFVAGIQYECKDIAPNYRISSEIGHLYKDSYARLAASFPPRADLRAMFDAAETTLRDALSKVIKDEEVKISNLYAGLYQQVDERISRANDHFVAAITEIQKIVDASAETAAIGRATAENAVREAEEGQSRAKAIDEKTKTTESNLVAFTNEARARGNFDQLKIEWSNRARSSTWAVWLSYAVILILIVTPVICLVLNYTAVMDYLKQVGSLTKDELGVNPNAGLAAVVAATRLALIGIPLILYFWVIRLAVKFNSRSMMLMDDSRARATMLETYYRMVAKDAAKDADRALVLAALFRPTPGYEADSGEPPTLISSVLNLAGGKG